jgi:cytochrome c-type biogenesis protein CcmH/NrfG
MTFDIPHMIATAFAVFGISWLVDHVSLFDAMSRGRKTLLLAALGLSLGAAPPLAAQQATDDHAGAVAGAAAPVSDALAAARAAFAAGELDPSLVALKTALQQNAFDQDALLLLADVLLARFDSASAEATLRRALEVGAPREQVLPALAKTMNGYG